MVPEVSKLVTRSLETSGTPYQATKRHNPEEWRNSPADLFPRQEEDPMRKRRAKMCFKLQVVHEPNVRTDAAQLHTKKNTGRQGPENGNLGVRFKDVEKKLWPIIK
jgi:hypothetical protein